MQTFLCYPDYARSAAVLDNKRLGKQRVECLQILQTLQKLPYRCKYCGEYGDDNALFYCKDNVRGHYWNSTPWYNHPAVRMWRGYNYQLCLYASAICFEWVGRGFKDTCEEKVMQIIRDLPMCQKPPWLTPEFCLSHQSNLLRKDPAFYRPIFGNEVPDDLPYIWPVK